MLTAAAIALLAMAVPNEEHSLREPCSFERQKLPSPMPRPMNRYEQPSGAANKPLLHMDFPEMPKYM